MVCVLDAILGVSLGLFFSAFAQTEFQAVQFAPIVLVPQLFLAGVFIPRDEMPGWLQSISNVLPLTYAVDALQADQHPHRGDASNVARRRRRRRLHRRRTARRRRHPAPTHPLNPPAPTTRRDREMYSFPHDDVTITVHPAQQDRHTVVFINGVFGGGWTWEPVVTALTAHGHGAVVTTEPLAAHRPRKTFPHSCRASRCLSTRLPSPRRSCAAILWARLVAMELAAADPSRWSGVILTGAPGLGDEHDAESFGSALRTPSLKLGVPYLPTGSSTTRN